MSLQKGSGFQKRGLGENLRRAGEMGAVSSGDVSDGRHFGDREKCLLLSPACLKADASRKNLVVN